MILQGLEYTVYSLKSTVPSADSEQLEIYIKFGFEIIEKLLLLDFPFLYAREHLALRSWKRRLYFNAKPGLELKLCLLLSVNWLLFQSNSSLFSEESPWPKLPNDSKKTNND